MHGSPSPVTCRIPGVVAAGEKRDRAAADVAGPRRAAALVVDDAKRRPGPLGAEDRADEVPAVAVDPRRAHDQVPRPRQHGLLARELRAPVRAERPGRVVLGVLARGRAREDVVGREVDDPRAGRRDVRGAAARSPPRLSRVALAPVDVGHGGGVDDEIGARRAPRRPRAASVTSSSARVEERRLGQVGAQREADLAARARYENAGTRSQASPGFWASRSLTTGSASICHGIASVGSFQATPCSSLGSYSPVTQ